MRWMSSVGIGLCTLLLHAPSMWSESAHVSPQHGILYVRIVGLPSSTGAIKVGLYRSKETYANRSGSFRKAVLPIQRGMCEWMVDGVPYGEYAVTFFHDENGNGSLDSNRLGIPIEPFGFSNNARPRFGPPPYRKVTFDVEDRLTTIEIRAQAI